MRYLYLVAAVLSLGIVGGLGHANEMVVNDSVIVEVGNKIPPMPQTDSEWDDFFKNQYDLLRTVYERNPVFGEDWYQRFEKLKKLKEDGPQTELESYYLQYIAFVAPCLNDNNCMRSK